jgi:hypothetical protein
MVKPNAAAGFQIRRRQTSLNRPAKYLSLRGYNGVASVLSAILSSNKSSRSDIGPNLPENARQMNVGKLLRICDTEQPIYLFFED